MPCGPAVEAVRGLKRCACPRVGRRGIYVETFAVQRTDCSVTMRGSETRAEGRFREHAAEWV